MIPILLGSCAWFPSWITSFVSNLTVNLHLQLGHLKWVFCSCTVLYVQIESHADRRIYFGSQIQFYHMEYFDELRIRLFNDILWGYCMCWYKIGSKSCEYFNWMTIMNFVWVCICLTKKEKYIQFFHFSKRIF